MSDYKFGICSWCLPVNGLYERLELIHELGLDSMELDIEFDENNPLLCADYCNEYLKRAEEYGVTFATTALNSIGGCDVFADGENKKLEKFLDIAIKVAINMKLKILQIPAFGTNSLESDAHFEKAVKLYQKICDRLSEYGMILGTENTISAEKNLELTQKVNRENFLVYFDTHNPYQLHKYDICDMLEKLDGKICEIHLKDGKENFGDTLLGHGDANFNKAAEVIKNSNYKGYLHLETVYSSLSDDKDEQIELLKADIKYMKELFA